MKKRLTLASERLSDLSSEELVAIIAAADETYTGNPVCIVSIQGERPPCVTNQFCTVFCIQTQ